MTDPLAANMMRAAAARHLAQAMELEENTKLTKEPEKRSGFSDGFYDRAIRTGSDQALRSQPTPTEPQPQQVADALRPLAAQEDGREGEDDVGSSVPSETGQT